MRTHPRPLSGAESTLDAVHPEPHAGPVTVGVLVRTAIDPPDDLGDRLSALPGVSTVELEEEGSIGLVLQGESLDEAHDRLRDEVQSLEGVLAAWPVHLEFPPTTDA